MVKKYKYGNPIETEAVIADISEENGVIEKVKFENNSFVYNMNDKTKVFGLGEANRGINKRGYKYVSYCTDDPSHTEDKESLYGAHNFIIIDGEDKLGIFFDNPGRVTFDIGYTKKNEIRVTPYNQYPYILSL